MTKPVDPGASTLRAVWPYAALAAVGAAYLWEILSLAGIPVARDMQMFFVPQKHLLWRALSEGRIPLWTPFIGTGSPFLANVQSGVFYPPHWLFAVLPFYTAFNLLIVLHFIVGGAFAYLLGRRLGWRRESAYIAAACWMLGGYFASLLNLVNALQGAAWAPGLAWTVLRAVDRPGHREIALVAVMIACAALAGEPQSFVFSVAAAATVAVLELRRRGATRRRLVGLAGGLTIAAAVAVGLVAIQLIPTLELLRESGRSGGLTHGEAAAFDLDPVRLIHLLVPPDYRDPEYAFGVRSVIGRGDPWLFSIYLGAVWPILAWCAWRNRARRAEVAVWSAIGVAGVVVAMGNHTPVYPWLFEHMPGVAAFRFPEKYLFATAFGAMLLAGWGAERLIEGPLRRSDRIAGLVYGALTILSLAAFHLLRGPLREFAAGFGNDRMMADFDFAFGVWSQNVAKLALLVWLALGLIWLARRGTVSVGVFGLLLAGLVTADLAVAHRSLNPVVEREFYETEPLLFRHVPLEEVRRDYRLRASRFDSLAGTVPIVRGVPLEAQKWMWQQVVAPNVGQTWSVLQQDAWDAIKLIRIQDERDLQRVLPEPARRWALLRLHSVRYVHAILPLEAGEDATGIPLDTLPGYLYEIERPLPRAYVVPAARRYETTEAVINAVLAPGFDPRAVVALVGRGAPGADSAARSEPLPGFPGARIAAADDHEVRVILDEVPADSGYLVLTDSHYPGWTAAVDGEERPIELANFFFRAVPIRPGDREVVFAYRSRPFETGRRIALVTLIVSIVAFGTLEWRRARAGPHAG